VLSIPPACFVDPGSGSGSGSSTSENQRPCSPSLSRAIPFPLLLASYRPPETMDDLIPILSKLQDALHTVGQEKLDLPLIVVIGSQSSGKSSCLEQIVGKELFPKGNGIVTRRPLVLQLQNLNPSETTTEHGFTEYGEFLHLPNRIFPHFEEIKKEIEKETARVAGVYKGISKVPIHLKIHSPHLVNLTLVDLPGITKVPVGDQPSDIETQTRNLVMEYIANQNSLILAVSSANVDIVNSESLKLAREVDPEGKRTIGVLTKLDLMDAGTHALDILQNRVYPLRHGWYGVVNRSQQDLQTSKPLEEAREKEDQFFQLHPTYRTYLERCGTKKLTKALNQLLVNHVREKLPEIKSKLNLLIIQTQQEINSYGDPIFTGKTHRSSLILRILTKYANDFATAIEGTNLTNPTGELSGGARIYYIFNNIYGGALESISPTGNLSNQDIRTAIRNSTGPRPSLFVPEAAFDLLIKPQINRLESPSLRCVELVLEELFKICNENCSKELSRFPKLKEKIIEVVVDLLRERVDPTLTYVESLVSIQTAYINTNHPDFIGGGTAISLLEQKFDRRRREQEKQEKEKQRRGSAGSASSSSESPSLKPITLKDIKFPTNSNHSIASSVQSVSSRESLLSYLFGGQTLRDREKAIVANAGLALGSMNYHQFDTPAVTESEPHKLEAPAHLVEDQNLQSQKDDFETQLIRSLITSYFSIVRKTLRDLVPKAIMHLLVNYSKEALQNRLVQTLYEEDLFSSLLSEDPVISSERDKCTALLEVYKKAHQVISET